ncbi:glycine-rich domain-containing protein [Pseudomonas putida]|uniref:glycine-rich domain-containing protein n=1 Tax=Pseudomonas putida TaxID=303 RepID=UPI002D78CAC8|nr:hypothetical protein [Pseudomonas putida]
MTNALALKAPLASPVFTGDPKAPTMAASDNDTSIATTAFVRAALALFGLGAPSANVVNIDDVSLNGFYVVGENTLGTKPKHPITGETLPSGQIMHIHRPSTVAATQLWDTLTSGEPLTFIRSRLGNSSQWTPWAQIWTSANSPKMDSLTDPTVGRVVTVGGHGVGRGILSEEVDLNRYTTPGNYVTAQYPINIPMGWLSSGRRYALSVEGLNSSGHLIQRLTSGLSGEGVRVAIRSFSASQQWSAWDELPVSQDRPFKGVQAYRAVGVSTWTVPAGVKKVWVTVIGGGGGGGFAPAANSVGSAGGGGGGLSQRLVDLGGVTSVAVTVGAGGTGATVAGDAGGTGGSSSFGTYLSATGGAGGGGNNPNGNAPGSGGRGAGGDYNTSLGAGAPNYGLFGGTGGGPGPRSTQASTSGGSAADAGGGGSGAYSGNAGGNGAPGCVIIHW